MSVAVNSRVARRVVACSVIGSALALGIWTGRASGQAARASGPVARRGGQPSMSVIARYQVVVGSVESRTIEAISGLQYDQHPTPGPVEYAPTGGRPSPEVVVTLPAADPVARELVSIHRDQVSGGPNQPVDLTVTVFVYSDSSAGAAPAAKYRLLGTRVMKAEIGTHGLAASDARFSLSATGGIHP